jgi:transposase
MALLNTEDLTFTDVRHLPIVKHFAKQIGLIDTIDTIVDTQMETSSGVTVLAMVLDSLSGRSPLYRLKEFFHEQDIELLLGVDVPAECFCDHNLGRIMDKIYETGTQKIFSAIAKNAVDNFGVDTRKVNFDTTSISVWGDYDGETDPFDITFGYSKDKRPDLKQFLVSMLCVDRNIPIGTLNETDDTKKRPAARYKAFDTAVTLHGKEYRAIVCHSSAHDKRRHKRIDRLLAKNKKQLEQLCKKAVSKPFFCEPDASVAAKKLVAAATGSYHSIKWQIAEVDKFPRGRPPKDKPRKPIGKEYHLKVNILEDTKTVMPLRMKAGCFVLITNLVEPEFIAKWPAPELLRLYKRQSGIEQNFGFLKDPVIVNSIFLKRPHRIEALGLVLLIALLIWRLIERCLRQHIQETGSTITGWKDKPTKRPTAFMMTTKFIHILVVKSGRQRQLAKPLKPVHLEYLKALNVEPDAFIVP